jgi:TetR/AcrR family transcriptional regulator, regulator of autoinduction and epiphytic fitness
VTARTEPQPEPTRDGRAQRSAATRERIVDALIGLHKDGHVRPTAQLIADRAGVSRRSVFEHFPDSDQLTRAVLDKLAQTLRTTAAPTEAEQALPLAARIVLFLQHRVRFLESMTPHRRAANQLLPRSPLLRSRRTPIRQQFQTETAQWFAPELARLPPARRMHWEQALGALTDWEMWDSLRTYPTRSVEQAGALLQSLFIAALTAVQHEATERPFPSDKNNLHY